MVLSLRKSPNRFNFCFILNRFPVFPIPIANRKYDFKWSFYYGTFQISLFFILDLFPFFSEKSRTGTRPQNGASVTKTYKSAYFLFLTDFKCFRYRPQSGSLSFKPEVGLKMVISSQFYPHYEILGSIGVFSYFLVFTLAIQTFRVRSAIERLTFIDIFACHFTIADVSRVACTVVITNIIDTFRIDITRTY